MATQNSIRESAEASENSTKNVVVSALKSTAVSACVAGHFRSSKKLDLLVGRSTRMELYTVEEDVLKAVREIPLFSRLALLVTFRLPKETLDTILVVTAMSNEFHLAVLAFNSNGDVQTRVSAQVTEKCGRRVGVLGCVHSSGLIALHLYEGRIKIIQWQPGKADLKSFNVSCRAERITDLTFFEGTRNLSIAFTEECGHQLNIESIDLQNEQLFALGIQRELADSETTVLIPVPLPFGGVLAIGSEAVCYVNEEYSCTVALPLNRLSSRPIINCYCRCDERELRFVLGDVSGSLYMLHIIVGVKKQISHLEVQYLGIVSIPESLAFLGASLLYVGSRCGDSQLVKLDRSPAQSEDFHLSVLESYCSIGPVRDIAVISNDQTHQIITCSGAFKRFIKEGSLRVIKSGIEIKILASVDLTAVKGVFPLKIGQAVLHNYLVVSFSQATHLLLLDGEEMEDTQFNGFELNQPTLWAGNMSCGGILQVNPNSVCLIFVDAGNSNASEIRWPCPLKISLCSVNADSGQIVLASGVELLFLLVEQGSNEILLSSRIVCRDEIACIDLSPTDAAISSKFLAVGFWSSNLIAIYSVEHPIEQVEIQDSSVDVLPRSLLMVLMDCHLHLLVGMGNGSVCCFRMNALSGKLTEKKVVTVGTQPVSLKKFISKCSVSVYVCCDRPAVIYSSMSKLTFASVNLQMVRLVAPLNSEYYKQCFVMADDSRLFIGTMDAVQKLHIRRITLSGNVSRIAYQPNTNTIAILLSNCEDYQLSLDTSRFGGSVSNSPQDKLFDSGLEEVHSICILDANSFEVQSVFKLEEFELGLSLISVTFDHSSTPFYCAGTALLEGGEKRGKGRIILLRAQIGLTGSGKLEVVNVQEVSGSVFAIDLLRNKLVCGIGNSLQIFEWNIALNQLQLISSRHGFTTVEHVKVHENLVLAGDMMRSISLLTFDDALSIFKEEGRDEAAEWLTACEIVDHCTFLAAESRMNIFCCKKIAVTSENLGGNSLKNIGGCFLGEPVNVLRRGSVSESSTSSSSAFLTNPVMFGTVDGGFGSIFQVSDDAYRFLLTLQQKIAAESLSCMGLKHNHYRKLCTETKAKESLPFIDGDLLETLLDMPVEVVERVVKGLKIPETLASQSQERLVMADEVLKLVEGISRAH